ncbi:MAG TPA: hypothetical protein VNX87_27190 [Candidatus Sulfotelmatobacter sp.]|nr:hypothetical protein [Candidatus Sulfotelmatobacter sp.]
MAEQDQRTKIRQLWSASSASIVFTSIVVVSAILWIVGLHYFGAQDTEHAVTALGIMLGGGWTFYQFVLRKSFESALSIDYSVCTEPRGQQFVVFFEVIFKNIGNRRITAPPRLTDNQIDDYEQSVRYPADLQIRELTNEDAGPRLAGWWSTSGGLRKLDKVPDHISLLFEYSRSDGNIDFFMEPKEKYVLGSLLLLPPGNYAAKIVFVGERAKAAEFWSRIVYFRVPSTRSLSGAEKERSS